MIWCAMLAGGARLNSSHAQEPIDSTQDEDPETEEGGGEGGATSESVVASDGDEDLPVARTYPIRGFLNLTGRSRWASGESDQDLFAYLTVDGGDPSTDSITFNVTARAAVDLNGGNDPGSLFFEVTDTYSNRFQPLLYRAYLDVNSFEELSIFRVGRQQDVDTPVPAYYDGIHLQSREDEPVYVGGYAGFSTHLFESTDTNDRTFGAYVGGRPWKSGRVRVDWMRARDHRRTPGSANDLYSVGIWQTFARTLNLDGFYSHLEGEGRDLRLRGTWYSPEQDLQVRGSYYQLLSTQTTSALDFDLFTSTLLDAFPFRQYSLSASKGWGPRFRLAGGLDFRRLENGGDAGQFNRDFDRYYLTSTFGELLWKTSSIGVTADYWDSTGRGYATLGTDLVTDLTDKLKSSIGTYFSKYKTRVSGMEERENVRTYFVRLAYELGSRWACEASYDFENTSIDDFHVLRVDLKWRF